MASPQKETFYILDGNAILHRAWHALPPLATKKGMMVNAAYGFLLILLRLMREVKPTYLAVAFDMAGPTFRHEAYEAYKATRVKAPDELYAQLPVLKEVLAAFHIPVFEKSGFEADDVIGTIVTKVAADGIPAFIVTGDLDLLQLVKKNISVSTFAKGLQAGVVYDDAAVHARFNLSPHQLIDWKAFRGDPSDNIKGVRGIGEKTATDLMVKFGSLDAIYSALKKKTPTELGLRESVVAKLLAGEDDARMSQNLVTIRCDVPIKFSLEDARVQNPDREKLIPLFQEYEFQGLVQKLPSTGEEKETITSEKQKKQKTIVHHELARTAAEVDVVIEKLKNVSLFALRVVSRPNDIFSKEILGLAVSWAEGHAACISVEYVSKLAPLLINIKYKKVGHDLKRDIHLLLNLGVELLQPLVDLQIVSYLLSPGSRAHDLRALAFERFGRELPENTSQGTLLLPRIEDLFAAACLETDLILQLHTHLMPELESREESKLLRDIEMPLVPILARIERTGVAVDVDFLGEMSGRMHKRLTALTKKIHEEAGVEFNINSPQQIKKILFETLDLQAKVRKTAGGELSTAASELERMRGLHPIIELIMEYRELSKLTSTYLESLPTLVRPETGRIHSTFNQTVAATGRLSSSDPNLQNIPIRTEVGREIRKAFVAPRGRKLISADYSQIELRLVAVIARCRTMLQAFRDGADIHTTTAAKVWGVDSEKVTKEQRRAAKAINFGIIYGIGPMSLSESAGISFAEAKEFIQRYFDLYPELRTYLDETKALALSLGYVETIFGRRRYLPEITSGVPQVRASAERMAINAPVQGSAADLMKLAMIAVDKWIGKEYGFGDDAKVKMILQVHDELIFEVENKEVERVAKKVQELMEGVREFTVPIVVDVAAGKSWGELEDVE